MGLTNKDKMQQKQSSLFQSEKEHLTTQFVVFTPKYVLWVCSINFDTLFSSLACKQDIHERTRTGTEESKEMDLQIVSSRLQNPLDPTEAVTKEFVHRNIEMHDLLTFCKIVADQYNFDCKRHITPIEKSSLKTTTSSPFYLPKIRNNFWYRTLQLHRILSRTVNLQELCYVKEGIQDYYWKFFINSFCEGNLCSWRINCQCRTCSP